MSPARRSNHRNNDNNDDDDEEENEGQIDGEGDDDDDGDDEDDDEVNPMTRLPVYVVKRVEKLQELDASREAIMEQYLTERSDMERKFAALLRPLFEERSAIVQGAKDDEIAKASPPEATPPPPPTAGEGSGNDEGGGNAVITGVPHFWVTALSNHDTVGELITEEDVDCLERLQDITCVDNDDGKGFVIQFKFGPNDYFSDTVLSKSYEVPNLLLSDEPMLKEVKGCAIHWKTEGGTDRCLTHRKIQKKQRGKGKKAGQVRTVTKTEKKESFFHWFETPPTMPANIENLDEEEVDEIEEKFTDDFEIAQAIRSEICPRAVLWFTGEAAEREMLEMMTAAGEAPE